MKKFVRIAYVLPALNIGGTELQLLKLTEALADEFEITFVLTREGGTLIGDVRRAGYYVRILEASSGWDFRIESRLRHAFRQHTPHIVHSFMFGFDFWVNRAARACGVPVIISSRRELATWQHPRHLWLQRRANRYVDAIIANSDAVADYAAERERLPRDRFTIIRNGLDAEHFARGGDLTALRRRFTLPEAGPVIGIVANFSPVKDYPLFVAMAERVLARYPQAHFFTIGSGPLVHAVGKLLVQHGVSAHFTRLATLNEVPDCLAAMDVFVLTSKMEGFPNAIMEAMAAGKAIVAPAVGGVLELLRDGETGRLISTRNAEDFADAVLALLDAPEERARLGQAAAAWVREHLPMQAMIQAHRRIYHQLLKAKLGGKK